MELLDKLNWRHAVKAMNGKQVPQEKIDNILEAIRLTATSSGLQPFEVLVIENQEIKEKIKPVAWNQSVITECSHLLVFAAWDTYTPERINEVFDLTNKVRGYENVGFENYRQMLLNTYPQKPADENFTHAAKQAYIAFGSALIAAAYEGVDATPMEGFDPAAVDEILGLKEKGLGSAILLPLGYRDEKNDWLHGQKKVRKSAETMFTTLK
ncbi:NAD(P)H-dependent oxidoreductase [Wenyingzhuangia marina]|uniref:Nitroreductase n=1 Tax=Wenyingzhuangia marina TaxID=1195760 RepID=A0A1M5TYP6_9FLAO|nr:NAD(P)H-dependent oxidoreductase [Wenyingzhuangia marina]GGF70402.1 NAD(P)H-dependent oxidoreductase [Wenyingzhuangia marina]SHH55869.1 Nitroreductase [Wenyingzhuangia marina]